MKRALWVLACCLWLVGSVSAQSGAPAQTVFGVPPDGEAALDLSGTWRVDTVMRLDEAVYAIDFDDTDWREVAAPARWAEQGIEPGSGILPTVAVYRRTFEAPSEWQGQAIGLAAWFTPQSRVALNGIELTPQGTAPWLYADVSDLLRTDALNTVVVSTQLDGIYDTVLPNPPRVGPLGEWTLPPVVEIPVTLEIAGRQYEATLYTGDPEATRPGVLMVGTGSHGLAFTEPYLPLARELAYEGYAALPLALETQSVETIRGALAALRGLGPVDGAQIAVIGAVESADVALLQAAEETAPQALITLSTRQRNLPATIGVPVLLIATTQDALGPTNSYAARIAETLIGPSKVLILPGKQSGLSILEGHWNDVRRATLDWLALYVSAHHAS